MAAKRKTPADTHGTATYVYLKDGTRHKVTAHDGKYLYCEDMTLRHTNPEIERVSAEER